ncbi:MAG: Uma2 family endonuclease [Chloroflexota bacterium]
MSVAVQTLSPTAYLAQDRRSRVKSDYIDGHVYQMAGASLNHNLIVAAIVGELYIHFQNHPCRVLPSDMRVRMGGSYVYPDIVIICDSPKVESNDILLNPAVVIEVLSSSTEAYDRGDKSKQLRTIPSLKEYALISQKNPHIEHYIRQQNNQWLFSETSSTDSTMYLPSIDFTLNLAKIYRDIDFE